MGAPGRERDETPRNSPVAADGRVARGGGPGDVPGGGAVEGIPTARGSEAGTGGAASSGAVAVTPESGWRRSAGAPSLPEVHSSVRMPHTRSFRRNLFAFVGPGLMVSVGYMDPGNWATDLAGGARFGYTLLSVVLISNFMAILLQHLALKLGIVTGRDLAQACRDP
jgi:hypothetical protein